MSSYDFTPIDKSTNGISNCMSKTEQPLKLHHAKQYARRKVILMLCNVFGVSVANEPYESGARVYLSANLSTL